MRLCRSRLLTALLALLLMSGCAGHEAAHEPSPAAGTAASGPVAAADPALVASPVALPAPSELSGLAKYRRHVSYNEADLTHNGVDFSAALPSRNVSTADPQLIFNPAWSAPADGAGKLALATYVFDAPGYDRESLLRTSWADPAPAPTELWFGLANWTKNRWDWRRSNNGLGCSPASLAPYLNFTGQLVVVLLRTGTAPSTLETIRLGSPVPNAVLTASPPMGAPPFSTTLDASSSSPTQGTLVKFEFDNGDGVFVDNGTSTSFPVEYPDAGAYTARVRVTDSLGAKAIASKVINVSGPWSHTYTRGVYDEVYGLLAGIDGNYYAVGVSNESAGHSQATVWKYDGLGTLMWVKAFSTVDPAGFDCVTSDFNGNLLLAGHVPGGISGSHGIVQAWSPDGEVLWAKKLNCGGYPQFGQIMCSGSNIFLTGTKQSLQSDVSSLALMVCLDLDGNLVWDRSWGADGDKQQNYLYSGGLVLSELIGQNYVVGAGLSGLSDSDIPSFEPNPLLLKYDLAGNFVSSQRLGSGTLYSWFTCMRVKSAKIFKTLELVGHAPAGGPQAGFVIQCSVGGTVSGSASWVVNDGSSNPTISPSAVLFSSAATGVVVLSSQDGYGLVTSIDPTTTVVGVNKRWDAAASGSVGFLAGASLSDGSLLAGGSSFITTGSFGDVAYSNGTFAYTFEDLPGTDRDAFVTDTDDVNAVEDLTGGQQDVITTGRAALVMHVAMP